MASSNIYSSTDVIPRKMSSLILEVLKSKAERLQHYISSFFSYHSQPSSSWIPDVLKSKTERLQYSISSYTASWIPDVLKSKTERLQYSISSYTDFITHCIYSLIPNSLKSKIEGLQHSIWPFSSIEQLKRENEILKMELSWRRVCKDTGNITLDVDSAHPYINIAPDKRSFTRETEISSVPPKPQCFDGIVAVLGVEGFSSGNHYWEVDIGNSNDWDVGVARKSIKRKGNITLSPKEGFWVLGFTGRDYFAKTDPWTRITVQRKPERIGIHLRFQENKVTFFNVTDFSILFEFKACEFSEEIYPFFKNGEKGKSMLISPVN